MSDEALEESEERYVAFLDLLGFKWLVEIAERDPAERRRLREVLVLVRDTLGENPHLGFRRNHFSDSIVLSVKRTAEGLWEMFQAISMLTCNLLQFDVLVRGGLTAGPAHHSADFAYGTAVSRAVVIESEVAKNPMTLLSQEVLDDARQYGTHHMGWLVDYEGQWFVHYLKDYSLYRQQPIYSGKVAYDDPAGRIIDFVCQRLNRDTGTVLAKAQWLQRYWNQTVANQGVFGAIEAGVTERYVSKGPTIMYRRMYMPNPGNVPPQT
jgi:hypothetical protein